MDYKLFRYLYSKNKDTFIGERYKISEDKKLIQLKPKEIDVVFYDTLTKYFPEDIDIKLLTSNLSEYQDDLEKEVQEFLGNKFYSTGLFHEKMRMYCEFMDKHQGNKEVSDMIYYKIQNPDFRKYYNFYGSSGCKAKEYIKKNLELGMIEISKETELSSAIHNRFKTNSRYTLKGIKLVLQDIYRDLGVTSKAKATDLGKYFKLISTSITESGKRVNGYLLGNL